MYDYFKINNLTYIFYFIIYFLHFYFYYYKIVTSEVIIFMENEVNEFLKDL